jgi:hypothetical protein
MTGQHRLKSCRAERTTLRRAVEVVDVHTFTAHLLADAAIAAGRLAQGRYIAICGQKAMTDEDHQFLIY